MSNYDIEFEGKMFKREKFEHEAVEEKIPEIFGDSNYRKILVVWNTEDNFARLPQIAEEEYGFELWGFERLDSYVHERKGHCWFKG
jgi:hypothetical protein